MTTANALHNILKNPDDPLKTGPRAGQELAARFGETASGFSNEHVVDATASVLLDLIRQTVLTRDKAHEKLDQLVAKMHEILEKHYDPVTGRRRHVFAFDQTISVTFTDDRKR